MTAFQDLTTAQLKQAIRIREQIELLQQQLSALLGGTAPRTTPNDPAAKHTPPAAGQTKTDAAPNWRLAHVRSPLDTLMEAAPRQTSGLTATGRAKLSAVMKAR